MANERYTLSQAQGFVNRLYGGRKFLVSGYSYAMRSKCTWRCEKHGTEYEYAFQHATQRKSCGCIECRRETGIENDKINAGSFDKQIIWFEVKAESAHGNRFRYIRYEKRDSGNLYATVDCLRHGLFDVRAATHLSLSHGGCVECAKEARIKALTKVKGGLKICPSCGIEKSLTEFAKYCRKNGAIRYGQCRDCKKRHGAESRNARNEEQRERYMDHSRRHGLTRARIKSSSIIEKVDASRVYKRDKYRCYLCGVKVIPGAAPTNKKAATIDHIHPLIKGGVESYSNVKTCCRSCNSSKHDKLMGQLVMQI